MDLKASVYVTNPATGNIEFLLAGSPAPDWAVDLINNPAVLDKADVKTVPVSDDDPTDEEPNPAPAETGTPARRRKSSAK